MALLAAGDVLALLLFSAVGRFSHGFPVLDFETLKTADPFIAGAAFRYSISNHLLCLCISYFGMLGSGS